MTFALVRVFMVNLLVTGTPCSIGFCIERVSFANQGGVHSHALRPLEKVSALCTGGWLKEWPWSLSLSTCFECCKNAGSKRAAEDTNFACQVFVIDLVRAQLSARWDWDLLCCFTYALHALLRWGCGATPVHDGTMNVAR